MKSSLSIGEVARAAGMRTSAVRYYEELGVLPAPDRANGRRVYGPETIRRLERIKLAQAAGFSLDEIKRLERGFNDEREAPARWRALAAEKLREVDAQLAQLQQMRALLHDATRCDCASMNACPLVAHRPARARRPAIRAFGRS